MHLRGEKDKRSSTSSTSSRPVNHSQQQKSMHPTYTTSTCIHIITMIIVLHNGVDACRKKNRYLRTSLLSVSHHGVAELVKETTVSSEEAMGPFHATPKSPDVWTSRAQSRISLPQRAQACMASSWQLRICSFFVTLPSRMTSATNSGRMAK